MKRTNPAQPRSSEITPRERYLNRREIVAGLLGAGVAALPTAGSAAEPLKYTKNARLSLKEPANSFEDITTYNNFYEFGTDKDDRARLSGKFRPKPWSVIIAGEADEERHTSAFGR